MEGKFVKMETEQTPRETSSVTDENIANVSVQQLKPSTFDGHES